MTDADLRRLAERDLGMTAETAATEAAAALPIPGTGPDGAAWQPTTGPIGGSRTADHQYSFSGVGPYPGVTGIIDVIEKQALREWKAKQVARAAVTQYTELGMRMAKDDWAGAIDWLMSLPGYQRDQAASIGSRVHHLADLLGRDQKPVEGFGISEQALPYARAFAGFLEHYSASNIVSSEKMVINFSEAYGGQYDLIMRIDGELWLVEIKTGRYGFYPETGLQLAAYQHAEYIMLPNDPNLYPMPQIERCAVLHLRPEAYSKGYRLVEYQVRDVDYRAFLSARNLYEWRKEDRFSADRLLPVTT